MYTIQILLPLFDEKGDAFPKEYYVALRNEFTEKYGGITAYTRSPASGYWKENGEKTVKDDIIIYEIMAEILDENWWRSCRKRLEGLFRQDEIIIRTWNIALL